jgi:hypothetical protein
MQEHICYDYVIRLLMADGGFSISRLVWLLNESVRYIPNELKHVISLMAQMDFKNALLSSGLNYVELAIDINRIQQYVLFALYDYFMLALESV